MLPIIISAPHACNAICDKKIRARIALTDEQIWKMSDPLTGRLEFFQTAAKKHIARSHRILGDLNQFPTAAAFRTADFYGHKIFQKNGAFTADEKKDLLQKNWFPYHAEIIKSIADLDRDGVEKILLLDFHSTAGDHPINAQRNYVPELDISNLSRGMLGKTWKHPRFATFPAKNLKQLKTDLEKKLGIVVETNDVFFGGYELMWFRHLEGKIKPRAKLFALQIEYNLDLVVNPITLAVNEKVLTRISRALDVALASAYARL